MLRLLPSLHALSKASAAGPRAPWPGPSRAGALSAHYRAGGAKPPAMQLPPGPRAASPLPGSRQPSEPCALRRRSSHDTFLAVRQLLERARSCGELLRWLVQNPDKVSAGHYALALQRLRRLFPRGSRRPGPPRLLLEQPDFQALTRAVASSCADFDHASLVRCLRASAALGLPGGCPLLQALEGEARRRRLGPLSQKHRSEARLLSLEREQRPQTPSRPRSAQVLPTLCRLLGQLKAAGEQELALLDETLAQCAPGAGDQALGALFSTPLFYENRQERFVRSMADWFPGKADGLTPPTMALIAKYLARHRLREPLLLDTIATFLLRRMEHLDIKLIQKLVFPFSRMNYRPSRHAELFPRLELALEQRAAASPLATLNVLMSLCQLGRFPPPVLRQVFSPAFLANVLGSPCRLIVRRYLSLLDVALALEVPGYEGPRLPPQHRVRLLGGRLTADEANRKYSYRGLVAEALRQLVGEGCFWQDAVLPPGYCADFLLRITPLGTVLPLGRGPTSPPAGAAASALQMECFSPFRLEGLGCPTAGSALSAPRQQPSPARSSSPARERQASLFASAAPRQEEGRRLPVAQPGPPACPPLSTSSGALPQGPEDAYRVVLAVNDKWHYCQNSPVLVGARAMCQRHLCLLGYHLVQLPYMELENMSGLQEAKHYLGQKLRGLGEAAAAAAAAPQETHGWN
ncbi:fas-activated serine/threonine kinase isoform X3 [Hemicordylus capensis]|nr:fas-activated serine/threonine kinase isoform X3 [Hemicordylus capensis]XP_053116352.1 fas-activated serine/threonine kinase isoform X3 [Hemicordylus capensis]XP_053116353.1 fas-activated serine/threonine kinase isoform X3 [Hemicordylus capensis]